MALQKTDLSLAQVKENVQKKEAIKHKRTEKDMDEKERKLFGKMYPMVPNELLATQFTISIEDVERLAHEMGKIKDASFTRNQMVTAKQGDWEHPTKAPGTAPAYLVQEVLRTLNEEERREALTRYEEGIEPIQALKDLAFIQQMRIARGWNLEVSRDEMWRVVNDAVDSYHAVLKSIFEMENGSTINQRVSFDDLLRERMNAKKN
jgi:hypothetical protein